jgi:hypothetical protein
MTWKHFNETLRDPSVWRDVYKDLIKDVIKYVLRGLFWLTVSFWLGSKLDPRIALAWEKVTGAFGPAWQALWRPLGVPRVIAATAFVVAVALPLLRWWRAWAHRKTPPTVVVRFVESADPPPPLTGDDLNGHQKTLLIMLWRIYPNSIALRSLLQNFEMTYPFIERLVESVERHGLVEIIPGYHEPKSVRLTHPRGRDFCHDNGLAVDH